MEKTARGLVEYAKAQLGRPYWYGTFGQAASKPLYNEKKRQYPNHYNWEYAGEIAKVHDCVGLVKGYLWCDNPEDNTPVYNVAQDKSANSMRDACTKMGTMATLPEVPGLLVFFDGHVGVYIGGGEVVEARSRKYGVYKSKLEDRPWKLWGYCPFVSYAEPEQTETEAVKMISVELPVLKKGAKGEQVETLQILLNAKLKEKLGNEFVALDVDGSFGAKTLAAVKQFQRLYGLAVDGSCGRKTWTKLLGV